MKQIKTKGFTLIEVLLVIAILAILAAVVIVAINPGKQLSEAQNAQRRSDVRAILDAVHQYAIDNQGTYPADIPSGADCSNEGVVICKSAVSCDGGINLDNLILDETYLTDLPSDPTTATAETTGYYIYKNGSERIGVCAPGAYGNDEIIVIR